MSRISINYSHLSPYLLKVQPRTAPENCFHLLCKTLKEVSGFIPSANSLQAVSIFFSEKYMNIQKWKLE